ncbi:Resolvase, N terminal domain [Paenibacillus sophorae]|uniref:Recombinase family protein n=1 Tax=Paenibacillus sophorae TaxID=1333845 RepID=A0A1H8TJM6_9BACL|nr:recombinase family protein [Paenibacillus sophorae]QWU16244.1 recombinase family protein [Paenibacillus sophorae]SEO90986.1 Resolvase, N terminal domain [Paenibacillus sophorae]
MKTKINAALYIRVSTEMQAKEGFSLEAQQEALLKHCRLIGATPFKVYVDAGRSGKSITGRPAMQEMLNDAGNGCFNQVMCTHLNRLSRNMNDLLSVLEALDKHKVGLYSLKEGFEPATPIGRFALQMMGAVAELEREQIVQNVRIGMQERSRQGN